MLVIVCVILVILFCLGFYILFCYFLYIKFIYLFCRKMENCINGLFGCISIDRMEMSVIIKNMYQSLLEAKFFVLQEREYFFGQSVLNIIEEFFLFEDLDNGKSKQYVFLGECVC